MNMVLSENVRLEWSIKIYTEKGEKQEEKS